MLDLLRQSNNRGLFLSDLVRFSGEKNETLTRSLAAQVRAELAESATKHHWRITPQGLEWLAIAAGEPQLAGKPCRSLQAAQIDAEAIAVRLIDGPWTAFDLIDYITQAYPNANDQECELAAEWVSLWLEDQEYSQEKGELESLTNDGESWAEGVLKMIAGDEPPAPESPAVTIPSTTEEAVHVTHPTPPAVEKAAPKPEPRKPAHSREYYERQALVQLIDEHGARTPVTVTQACAITAVIGLDSGQADYQTIIDRPTAFVDLARESLVECLRDHTFAITGLPAAQELATIFGIDWADVERGADTQLQK